MNYDLDSKFRSEIPKDSKKPQKKMKKALTFWGKGAIMYKLTRTAPKSQANGTEP